MPTGFNAAVVVNTFLAVLIAGTAWRLMALHAISSGNSLLRTTGQAMAFQY